MAKYRAKTFERTVVFEYVQLRYQIEYKKIYPEYTLWFEVMRLMMLFTHSPVSAIILVCCNMIVLRIRLGEVEVLNQSWGKILVTGCFFFQNVLFWG